MEKLEDLDKKEKMILQIKKVSRDLHEITHFLFDCDRENPELQRQQLTEAAEEVGNLVGRFAEKDYLNSVCLKVFVAAIQLTLKSFIGSLRTPNIVRPEDLS